MLEKFVKKFTGFFTRHDHINESNYHVADDAVISKNLDKNTGILKGLMGDSADFQVREILMAGKKTALIYIDGMVNAMEIEQNILKPLLFAVNAPKNTDEFINSFLPSGEIEVTEKLSDICCGFLSGNTAILIDGFGEGVVVNTKGFAKRSIDDPQTDSVIRGPREGFIESIRINTALIRRKIKNTALADEPLRVGRKSKTSVELMYLKDAVNPETVKAIRDKINAIDCDAIYDSGYIQEYLECNPSSIFSTIAYTEKPDIAAAKIMEGRVAIIVDGSPFVLTAPMFFNECFQSPEDYYVNPIAATSLRLIRFLSFFISIMALPFYVAITTFQQGMIPLSLFFSMASAEANTPFPAIVEAFVMIVTFEILKESGVRLPKPVGQAVSIVGALVIGESAVTAGLIGAPMLIAVSITAVAAFVVPMQANSIVILRYFLLLMAGTMGGFGITTGLILVAVHLSSLRSFGVPFFAPYIPLRTADLKDSVIRVPLFSMLTRPTGISRNNPRRQVFKKIWETGNEKN